MACEFSFRVLVRKSVGATPGSITVDRFTGTGPFQVSVDNGLFTNYENVVGSSYVKTPLVNSGYTGSGYNVRVKNTAVGCGMALSKGNFNLDEIACSEGAFFYLGSWDGSTPTSGSFACLVSTPDWDDTGNFRCVTVEGLNTGYQEKEQVDNNPDSESYLQTRWVTNGLNTGACPLPNGNTGFKGWATLEQYYTDDDTLTGITKDNDPEDPDYIAPVYDPDACPLY